MTVEPARPSRTSDILAYDRRAGRRTHVLISRLCQMGADRLGEPSIRVALAEAKALMRGDPMPRGRDAATQRMAFGALAFWRDLLPRPAADFEYLGHELAYGSARVDGAFRIRCSGQVFFEEIKSGHWRGFVPAAHHQQVETYLEAGVTALGAAFVGLRYLNLTDPRGRFWVTPAGDWEPYRAGLLAGR